MAYNTVQYSATKQVSRKGDNPSTGTLDASMAVLVGQGATPTQAQVNIVNADWTAFKSGLSVVQAGQVIIQYDTTATKNQIKEAILALQQQIEGTS